jgi:hypothetical protein
VITDVISIENPDTQHIMPNPTEKIWDRERQRRNRKLERTASALGVSVPHDQKIKGSG